MPTFISCSKWQFLLLLTAVVLMATAGCVSLGALSGRYDAADHIAAARGFTRTLIRTKGFTLTAYRRFSRPGSDLTVYIEGDGAAWVSRRRLSADPTPAEPLVLELAVMDPAANVAYLARPGQYSADLSPDCDPLYWSDKRFSREVVDAMNEAIDRLCADSRSRRVDLVGYSGGAAIAVLIALRRSDVASLTTVAGNLDIEAVNRHHGVSPLQDCLNPIDQAERLKNMPQRHFVGSQDAVVPPFIAESFLRREGDANSRRLTVLQGVSHSQGWRERWRSLLAIPPIPDR